MNEIHPAFEKNGAAVVLDVDDAAAAHAGVTIESILTKGSKENTYDIVLLHSGLDGEIQKKLSGIAAPYENVSLRLADVKTEDAGKRERKKLIREMLAGYERVLYLRGELVAVSDVAELVSGDAGETCLLSDYSWLLGSVGSLTFDVGRCSGVGAEAELIDLSAAPETEKVRRAWNERDQKDLDELCGGNRDACMPLPADEEEEVVQAKPKLVNLSGLWTNMDAPYADFFWECALKTPFVDELVCRMAYFYQEKILDSRNLLQFKTNLEADLRGQLQTLQDAQREAAERQAEIRILSERPVTGRAGIEEEIAHGGTGMRYLLRLFKLWLRYKMGKRPE